jgi:hypothetical protein
MTLCELVPAGVIEIDGRRWEATSRSGLIPKGTLVNVVAEEMGHLFVLPVANPSDRISAKSSSMNSLDQPADDLGIDSL